MANGLFGSAENWRVIVQKMAGTQLGDPNEVVLHVSKANQLLQTFDGIDTCGSRLANEISALVNRHPSLTRISLVGHSLGGLLLRHAAGELYCTRSRTIAGLRPMHYVSLATPHTGCDPQQKSKVGQVPFIGWSQMIPVLGPVLAAATAPVASTALSRTGAQLFYNDCPNEPLLVRLSQGAPLEALKSFATRTLYANADGDHIVGWGASALAPYSQLPSKFPEAAGSARLCADPVEAAWGGCAIDNVGDVTSHDDDHAAEIRARLASMAWRRVHCSWRDATVPLLGHNHLQVTRGWVNSLDGDGAAEFIARQLALTDAALCENVDAWTTNR